MKQNFRNDIVFELRDRIAPELESLGVEAPFENAFILASAFTTLSLYDISAKNKKEKVPHTENEVKQDVMDRFYTTIRFQSEKDSRSVRTDATFDDWLIVADLLDRLGDSPYLFRYSVSDYQEFTDIVADLNPDFKAFDVPILPIDPDGVVRKFCITNTEGEDGFLYEYDDGKVGMNLFAYSQGHGGSFVFHCAANYCFNNMDRGLQIEGDRMGYTLLGKIRFFDLMLSSALHFKTTLHLAPNIPDIPWNTNSYLEDLAMMLAWSNSYFHDCYDEIINDVVYNFEKHTFEAKDKNGEYHETEIRKLRVPTGIATRDGTAVFKGTTVARAVFIESTVQRVVQGTRQGRRDEILDEFSEFIRELQDISQTPFYRIFYDEDDGIIRGQTEVSVDQIKITLFPNAHPITFLHESAHALLCLYQCFSNDELCSKTIRNDFEMICNDLGADPKETISTQHHERFAHKFTAYITNDEAPDDILKPVFSRFKRLLNDVCQNTAHLEHNYSSELKDVF